MRTNHRLRKIGISLLTLAFLMPTAIGQAAPASTQADKAMFDYRETTLDNGLHVVTLEDFSCPIVAVQIWYHVGSKNEDPQRQGFAHMFEHMMFRGTDRLGPTDHFGFIRRVGGSTNGYTSFDRTVYLETLPADQLELALWLEAERMAFLKIDQEAFVTERKVVEEERRNGLNEPYGTLVENVLAELYKVHPYSWPPIGKIAHLEASSVEELREFWQRYYVPNNATLVIVGAVKHNDAQKLAKQYFGWIPRSENPPKVTVKEPRQTEKRSVTIKEANAPAPGVGMVWRTVPLKHKDTVALDLLSEILGGGNSSRVYRELVAEKQLAVQAQTIHWSLEQDGIFGVGAVLSPLGGDADKVLEVVQKHIDRLRTEPVTEKELTKAKNQMLRSLVTQNLEIESKARMLGAAAVDCGDVSQVNRDMDEVKSVTADDILRVAQEYLAPERAMDLKVERNLLGMVTGAKEKTPTTATAPAPAKKAASNPGKPGLVRSENFPKEPPLARIATTKLTPKFTRKTLANGLKVMVVPNHEVPFVSVQLGLLSGAWTEDKPGAAAMAMSMLTKGTEKHTEGELAEELETYAVNISGGGGMDTSSVAMSCLTEQIERGMALLGEVSLSPSFPENEFGKLRKQVLTGLTVASAEPEYIVEREYRKQLYGEHPYSRTATGEVADVEALKIGDLKNWYETYVRPDMAVLIIAGDIDENAAFTLAEKTFGGWKAEGPKPEKTLPPMKQPGPNHIYLVDRPGSIQSQIRVGQLGITRKHDLYSTSRVVSNYFGWSFNSRLNRSIRVAKGLTYSVWGSYIAQNFAGDLRVGTFSKTDSTAQAVRAVLDEIGQLKTKTPTDEELQTSQSYILGSFVGGRETPQQIAGDLWLIESQDLGDDYLDRLLDGIAETTSDDCQKLVSGTIDPEKMVIVVVGEADKIKADLEKIAPVTVIPAEKK